MHSTLPSYDPARGQFLSPDTLVPDAGLVLDYNRYMYVRGNPLKYTDPSGHTPYAFTFRTFAPFRWFGGGFNGNDRGYSSDLNASVKIAQRVVLETDSASIVASQAWSNETYHRLAPDYRITEHPDSEVGDVLSNSVGDVRGFSFDLHVAGANPYFRGMAPDIDVYSSVLLIENRQSGMLSVQGTVTGDNFPATEALISDPTGQTVMLGAGFYRGSPYTSLPGRNRREIMSFNFHISIDEEGNFLKVLSGGHEYSIEEWNSMFTNLDPHGGNP